MTAQAELTGRYTGGVYMRSALDSDGKLAGYEVEAKRPGGPLGARLLSVGQAQRMVWRINAACRAGRARCEEWLPGCGHRWSFCTKGA